MTASRIVVANGTVAVTRRTAFRKLFWTPSDPGVEQGYLYALACAQREYGFELHHGQLLPSHSHLTMTPRDANAPEIFRHVHRESARFLQEWLLENGYDAPANVWDDRPTHDLRLVDAGSQLRWPLYSHLNCVAAGLVERVEDYPGYASDFGWMKGGTVVVKKPPLYYGKDRPSELVLRYSPPPRLLQAFDGDVEAMVYRLRKLATELEDRYRAERRASGSSVMGAEVLKRVHPWAEPRTARERRGQHIPRFMVGGLEDEDVGARRQLREQLKEERGTFLYEQRESLGAWRGGDRGVEFPAGTYKMRVLHGAKVAEPKPGAILCAPDREAAEGEVRPEMAELLRDVVEDVRKGAEPVVDELREVTWEDESPSPAVPARYDGTAGEAPESTPEDGAAPTPEPKRPPASGTRLRPPAATALEEHSSRLVTMRNRRDRGPP